MIELLLVCLEPALSDYSLTHTNMHTDSSEWTPARLNSMEGLCSMVPLVRPHHFQSATGTLAFASATVVLVSEHG